MGARRARRRVRAARSTRRRVRPCSPAPRSARRRPLSRRHRARRSCRPHWHYTHRRSADAAGDRYSIVASGRKTHVPAPEADARAGDAQLQRSGDGRREVCAVVQRRGDARRRRERRSRPCSATHECVAGERGERLHVIRLPPTLRTAANQCGCCGSDARAARDAASPALSTGVRSARKQRPFRVREPFARSQDLQMRVADVRQNSDVRACDVDQVRRCLRSVRAPISTTSASCASVVACKQQLADADFVVLIGRRCEHARAVLRPQECASKVFCRRLSRRSR